MVDDLIDLSRIDTGKLQLREEQLEVDRITHEVLRMFEGAARRGGVSLEPEIESFAVRADSRRLKQILTNLLSNALKFTPDGGRISLSVSSSDPEFVQFVVSDTGRGIPQKEQALVFQRLHQCAEDAAIEQGLGIGLSLCKELVEPQGGKIWVRSAEGEGSQFYFTLPRVELVATELG